MADWSNLSAFGRLQRHGSIPKGTPQICAGIGVIGMENCRFSTLKPPYLLKWRKNGEMQLSSE